MTEEMRISELIQKTAEALLGLGLAAHTVWNGYGSYYLSIVRFHEQHGDMFFNRDIMVEYGRMIRKRFENGEISRGYYGNLLKATERVIEFHDTGKLEWSCRTRVSKFKLNPAFEKLLEDFLPYRQLHRNTRGDFIWVVRKYLSWLQQEGHRDINTLTVKDISKFVFYCSKHLKSGSLHNVVCYMKQFHQFLEKTGHTSVPYRGVLSIPFCARPGSSLPHCGTSWIESYMR